VTKNVTNCYLHIFWSNSPDSDSNISVKCAIVGWFQHTNCSKKPVYNFFDSQRESYNRNFSRCSDKV